MSFDFSTIEVPLALGPHRTPEEGLCALEMVAFFNGEEHSDHPACVCNVLSAYTRNLNDRMSDAARNLLLKPVLPRLVGTVSAAHEQARCAILVHFAVNKAAPIVFRAAGLDGYADNLATSPDLKWAAFLAAEAKDAARRIGEADAVFAAHAVMSMASLDSNASKAAWASECVTPETWGLAVEALKTAIKAGPQGDFAYDPVERHEKLKELVRA